MSLRRSLRLLFPLFGVVCGAMSLAQSAVSRADGEHLGFAAKAAGWNLDVAELDAPGDGDFAGVVPVECFRIVPPCFPVAAPGRTALPDRLADRRGFTLVGVVQLLV
jgi:hypothetical protein